MIKKIGSKYIVLSEKGDRKFGAHKTLKEAKHRLQQIEFFKHLKPGETLKKKNKK